MVNNLPAKASSRSAIPKVELRISEVDGSPVCTVALPHDLHRHLGGSDQDFAGAQVDLVMKALSTSTAAPSPDIVNSVLSLAASMKPKTEMQGALAIQMAVTHTLSMQALGGFHRSATPEIAERRCTNATKLQRTFLAQAETFSRLKRGGRQTVVVQHTTVQAGGQAAVIGKMSKGGGRGRARSEVQSHAHYES